MRILIDIEALFDWRYAKMCKVNETVKFSVLEQYKEYTERDHDSLWKMFSLITREDYKKVPFTLETLALAQLTQCDILIMEAIAAYAANPNVKVDEITIDVDFMGLNLSPKVEDKFKLLISSRFDHKIKINVVSLKQLNPRKIDSRYQLAIIYDLDKRLFPVQKKPKDSIKYCNFYTPFRFKEGKEEQTERYLQLVKEMPYKTDHHTMLEEHLMGAAPIHFIEMRYFCLRTPM